MNVFDFDNTLYKGESSVDFALFMIKNNKKIILWLPKIFWNLFKYKLCLLSKDEIENMINDFMKAIVKDKNEVLNLTEDFWKKYKRKLNKIILEKVSKDDVIITAGPSFLIEAIKSELGTCNMICSEVDLDKKQITYLNFSANKVKRYRDIYNNQPIDNFYTDSYNDKAMMDISNKVFLVKGNIVKGIFK